jgi:hypothetical protein
MVIVRIIECSTRLKIPLVRNFAITKNKYPGCTTLSYSHGYFCSFFIELNTLASDTMTSGAQLSESEWVRRRIIINIATNQGRLNAWKHWAFVNLFPWMRDFTSLPELDLMSMSAVKSYLYSSAHLGRFQTV